MLDMRPDCERCGADLPAQRARRVHLQLRMHLLRGMRRRARRALPELRRRAARPADARRQGACRPTPPRPTRRFDAMTHRARADRRRLRFGRRRGHPGGHQDRDDARRPRDDRDHRDHRAEHAGRAGRACRCRPTSCVAQIDACVDDIGVDAVKIGMIGSAETAHAVADVLEGLDVPIVFDPVMVATSGSVLADADTIAAFERLMRARRRSSRPTCPNWPRWAARRRCCAHGCHLTGQRAGTATATSSSTGCCRAGGEVARVVEASASTRAHTHGTGCTFASALATGLAQGHDAIEDAFAGAVRFVRHALIHGAGAGHGPRPDRAHAGSVPFDEIAGLMPGLRHEKLCLAPVAGVDEAGRGPLAGPVVAAAVILPAQGRARAGSTIRRSCRRRSASGCAARLRGCAIDRRRHRRGGRDRPAQHLLGDDEGDDAGGRGARASRPAMCWSTATALPRWGHACTADRRRATRSACRSPPRRSSPRRPATRS